MKNPQIFVNLPYTAVELEFLLAVARLENQHGCGRYHVFSSSIQAGKGVKPERESGYPITRSAEHY